MFTTRFCFSLLLLATLLCFSVAATNWYTNQKLTQCSFINVAPVEGFVTFLTVEGRPVYQSRVKKHSYDVNNKRLCVETYAGQLFEWRGEYLWSDQPVRLTVDALVADHTEATKATPYGQTFN